MYAPVAQLFGQLGRGSVTFVASRASCISSGAVPVTGTNKALSSAGNGLFSTVGMSPNICKASMASLVSVDIAGVSTIFDLGTDVSLVEGCVSVAGFEAASKFFLVFLFLTGLGRCKIISMRSLVSMEQQSPRRPCDMNVVTLAYRF